MNLASQEYATYFKPRFPEWRAPFEFYPTPPSAIRALLPVETFEGDIWEPASRRAVPRRNPLRAFRLRLVGDGHKP